MSVAIYYTSVRPAEGQEQHIYGLNVAISDLIRSYFLFSQSEFFTFLIGHEREMEDIRAIAAEVGVSESRLKMLDRRFPGRTFTEFECVFRPEPGTRKMLWLRETGAQFAFCGLAHAISGLDAGEVLQEYILEPSRSSDAIICPSKAVKAAIRKFWDSYTDILRLRFQSPYQCPVQLPVIPLGIDCEKFAKRVSHEKRIDQRSKLGFDENDVVLLWVGRLSAAIKAHPLAMYQAAEGAAQQTKKRIRLIMVGYFVPQEAQGQFEALASLICTKASVHFISSQDPRFPDGLWAAGDIFLSLVDNMQESFGLTPIEAMAAGLPRVVSDWNGYKDSIVDGEDGFLVPTTQPPQGNGFELTAQLVSDQVSYGGYLAKTALTVAIDVEKAVSVIVKLVEDTELYQRIKNNATRRVLADYQWKTIIPRYEALWTEMANQRQFDRKMASSWSSAHPLVPDPYHMYESFPSRQLSMDDRLFLSLSLDKVGELLKHDINTLLYDVLISSDDIAVLLKAVATSQGMTIAQIFRAFSQCERPRLWRTLAWLQKLGIFKNVSVA